MTITEAEIRTALARAVEQADRSIGAGGVERSSAPARRPRGRVLLVAAAILVVLAGVGLVVRGDGERVRTGPAATVSDPPVESTTSVVIATTTAAPPASVRVGALNGSATSGVAGVLCEQLAGIGYSTCVVDNAWKPFEQTEVFYAPGQEDAARQLAGRLGIGRWSPMPPEVTSGRVVAGSDVVVAVGSDGVTVTG